MVGAEIVMTYNLLSQLISLMGFRNKIFSDADKTILSWSVFCSSSGAFGHIIWSSSAAGDCPVVMEFKWQISGHFKDFLIVVALKVALRVKMLNSTLFIDEDHGIWWQASE